MCVVEQSLVCLEDASDVEEITSTDNHDEDDMSTQRNSCRRAYHCRSLLTDDRVLANLLATERNNRPSADCFCRQTEVLPYMRDTVVTWMLEVRSLKFHFFPSEHSIVLHHLRGARHLGDKRSQTRWASDVWAI